MCILRKSKFTPENSGVGLGWTAGHSGGGFGVTRRKSFRILMPLAIIYLTHAKNMSNYTATVTGHLYGRAWRGKDCSICAMCSMYLS